MRSTHTNESQKSVAIIGAGPAGLIAAETLASAGRKVTVYEQKPSAGRKFLMAGRGGLNLTHSEPLDIFLTRYNDGQPFLTAAINSFNPEQLRAWCEDLGQETFVGSSGRVFPKAMKASPLLRAWMARLERLGVTFEYNCRWTGWDDQGALTFLSRDKGEYAITPDDTLLALGGASWPSLGSDGKWCELLRDRGVTVHPFKPSNCGFEVAWSDYFRERFAGQPLKNITLTCGDQCVSGEAMIAQRGIEGGAVYALSAWLRDQIERDGSASLSIDLRPSIDVKALEEKLSRPRSRQSFSTFLQKTANLSPLAVALLREARDDAHMLPASELATTIKNANLTLIKPFPIERAISSAGGISLGEIDGNFMLKKLPRIYVAGEMLDWEAPTGGYLLQASFATGIAAAAGILRT